MFEVLAWLIAALGAVGGLLFGRIWGRVEGKRARKREAEHDAYEDTLGKLEAGRKAVSDGRDLDPADRLRRNDGRW